MAKRRKYDFERLNAYCEENSVTLLEDYSNSNLTITSIIKGGCIYENCKNEFVDGDVNVFTERQMCFDQKQNSS